MRDSKRAARILAGVIAAAVPGGAFALCMVLIARSLGMQ